jgi:uncharacterized membrane-anchored protein
MKNNNGRDPSLAGLRSVTLIVLAFGAITSIGLLRRAQQHPPPIIVVGFIVWVTAPFALLAMANILSTRWARAVRVSLFAVTLLVTAASLAIYFDDSIAHRRAKPAFVYVALPPVSVIVSAIVLALAAFMTKQRRTGPGSR